MTYAANNGKHWLGTVVSDKMDKTVVVSVQRTLQNIRCMAK